MCGIYGIIFPRKTVLTEEEVAKANEALLKLTIANTTRGIDAFGYFVVYKDNKVEIVKKASPVWNAMDGEFAKKFRFSTDENGPFAIIAHTRAKSPGLTENSLDTSHPHEVGDIVGVHNGFISNYKGINKKYEASKEKTPDSDSFELFKFINDNGMEDLSGLKGAAAIIFVRKTDPTKFYVYSHGRPLHFSYLYKNGMMFSSEHEHLVPIRNAMLGGKKAKKHYHLNPHLNMTINANKGNKWTFGITLPPNNTTFATIVKDIECIVCSMRSDLIPVFHGSKFLFNGCPKDGFYCWECNNKKPNALYLDHMRTHRFLCKTCTENKLKIFSNAFDMKCDMCNSNKAKLIINNITIRKLCDTCFKEIPNFSASSQI